MVDTTYQYSRRMVTLLSNVNLEVLRYRLKSFVPMFVKALDKAKDPGLDLIFHPIEIEQILKGEEFHPGREDIKGMLDFLRGNMALKQSIIAQSSPTDYFFANMIAAVHEMRSSIEMLTHLAVSEKVLRPEEGFYQIPGAAFLYDYEGPSTLHVPLMFNEDYEGFKSLLMFSSPTVDLERGLEGQTETSIVEHFIAKVINNGNQIRFISD